MDIFYMICYVIFDTYHLTRNELGSPMRIFNLFNGKQQYQHTPINFGQKTIQVRK